MFWFISHFLWLMGPFLWSLQSHFVQGSVGNVTEMTFVPTGNIGIIMMNNMIADDSGKNVMGLYETEVYMSQDYGFNWFIAPLPGIINNEYTNWQYIAVSGNGQQFYAGGYSWLYQSTKPSVSWSAVPGFPSGSKIVSIATDYTGNFIFTSGIYYNATTNRNYFGAFSSDGGQTFSGLTNLTRACTVVTMDNSGANLVCAVNYADDYVYVSSDYGKSFTYHRASSAGIETLTFVSSPYNGNQYMYMPCTGSLNVFLMSSDYGQTWSDISISNAVMSVFGISSTGNGQSIYIATNAGLFYSHNAGQNWLRQFTYEIYGVAVSKSGANVYINTVYGLMTYHNESSITGPPTFPPTMAPTPMMWTDIDLPTSSEGYNFVAMNEGGSYIVTAQANGMLVSYSTETAASVVGTNSASWLDICMSSDGSRLVAIGNNQAMYKSGSSIAEMTQAPVNTSSAYALYSCAMTSSGNVTVVAQQGSSGWTIAKYQTNNENVFEPVFIPIAGSSATADALLTNVAIDCTGEVLAIMTQSGALFLSTNGGLNWANSGTISEYGLYFTMSQTNHSQNMMSVAFNVIPAEYSLNQGKTWNAMVLPSSILHGYSLEASYSGQVAIMTATDGVYVTMDYGASWESYLTTTTNTNQQQWATVDPSGQVFAFVQKNSNTLKVLSLAPTQSPTIAPSTVPTLSPTAIPTQFPTQGPILSPTISPTRLPIQSPTRLPTSTPILYPTPAPLSSGWLYAEHFMSTSCEGTASLISGYRLNTCFAGNSSTEGGSYWYSYDCTSTSKTFVKNFYPNDQCSGDPMKFEKHNNPTTFPTPDGYCNMFQCTTSSSSLPIVDSSIYSLDEFYNDGEGMDGTCFNAIRYDGILNNQCVSTEATFSVYATFPYTAYFNNSDCHGEPMANISLPTGCTGSLSSLMSSSFLFDRNDLGRMLTPAESHHNLMKHLNNYVDLQQNRDVKQESFYFMDDDRNGQYEGHSHSKFENIPSSSSSTSSSLPAGAIAGIVVGIIVAVCLTIALIVTIWQRRQSNPSQHKTRNSPDFHSGSNPLHDRFL